MLPEGWKTATVESVCDMVSVGVVVNPSHYYVSEGEGVRAFRSGNVRENSVQDNKWVYFSPEGHAKNKKSELRAGDVLVVRTGSPGTACVLPESFAGSNCIDILFARPNISKLTPEYLSELTNSEIGRRQVLHGQSGLAQKHLNVGAYQKMRFGLPPVHEQRRITLVLKTWNDSIAIAERLLAVGRKYKEILAHQLLTGKRQLRRFGEQQGYQSSSHGRIPKHWKFVQISNAAEEVSNKLGSGSAHPVLSCTKHEGLVDSLTYFNKQVFSADTSTYKVAPRSCFVYATNHIEEGSIGYQNLYDFGLVSPMYTVFKTDSSVCDGYLYRLLKTEHYRQIFAAATNASVDRRGSLRWNDFKKLRIPLPPLAEQEAIASLFVGAEREIDLLKFQLKSLQTEKAALMAQLLTGKRRVRLPEPEAELAS